MGLCKLIVIVGVAALVMQTANSASVGGSNNACLCTREYFPVCGSDGQTYSNKCVFECEKRRSANLEIVYNGDCDDFATANEEVIVCTTEYMPICGSDGVTYPNKCMFNYAQKTNKALKFATFGECVEAAHDEVPCLCTREYQPVCGTDGNTYSNKCMFKCAQKNNKALEFASFGQCEDQVAHEEMCVCTREYNPICGNNGKTYSNKCMFKCAQKTNHALQFASFGECTDVNDVKVPKEATCMCTMIYQPVCGSDGNTYSNECVLKCAQKTNQALGFVSFGQCEDKVAHEEVAICTMEFQPICGSDGNTYSNKCVFNYAQKTNKALKFAAFGECVEAAHDEILCACTKEYRPVCGSDGNTYSNKCVFKCAQKNNQALEFASFGRCGKAVKAENVEDSCVCTREYVPVCGSDGKTYGNKCMFNCAKSTNQNLELFASGECVEVSNLPMDGEMPEVQNLPLDDDVMCLCTREYEPMCGTDGKTYSNKCMFRCAQKTNQQLELFATGVCVPAA